MKLKSRINLSFFSLLSCLCLYLTNYFYVFKVRQSEYDYTNYYLNGYKEINLISNSDINEYDKNVCYFEDEIICSKIIKFYSAITSLKNISNIVLTIMLITAIFCVFSLRLNLDNNKKTIKLYYIICLIISIMNFYSSLLLSMYTALSFITIESLAFYGFKSVGRLGFSFGMLVLVCFTTFLISCYLIVNYIIFYKDNKTVEKDSIYKASSGKVIKL